MTPSSQTRTERWLALSAVAAAVSLAACDFAAAAEASGTPGDETSRTEIRIARSTDGMSFDSTAVPLALSAGTPSLTELPGGGLLALYSDESDGSPRLMQTVSRDYGRTWSAAAPVRIAGLGDGETPVSGTLTILPSRIGRLFFLTRPGDAGDDRTNPSGKLVRSAITRDGRTYRLERGARAVAQGYPRRAFTRVVVAPAGRRLQLFVTEVDRKNDRTTRTRRILLPGRYRSVELSPPVIDAQCELGSILEIPGGLRAFAALDNDIVSYRSRDGRRWLREPGTRLRDARAPAAVKLGGTNHLVLSVAAADPASAQTATLVESGEPYETYGNWIEDDAWKRAADDYALQGADAEPDDGVLLDEFGNPPAAEGEGFPPALDLDNPINYFEWYKNEALPHPEENAYDVYAAFIPGMIPGQEPREDIDWPEIFTTMLNSSFDGPTGPWHDEDHPDWAQFSDQWEGLLRKFADAAKIPGYASPPMVSEDNPKVSSNEPSLVGILLPNLSALRMLVKATISDAWRVRDGRVDPDRISAAIETVLRSSAQVEQGATLIEGLVGMASRHLARDSARRALDADVLSQADRARLLDTLRTFDGQPRNMAEWLRGEYAFGMQYAKTMFKKTPAGDVVVNQEHLADFPPWEMVGENPAPELAQMTEDDFHKTVDTLDRYYRELAGMSRIGYPDVRRADIEALETEAAQATPLTQQILPSLSRAYVLSGRVEAERRATQLAFELYAFRDRHHRWPVSLDEVQVGGSTDVRIDPFSGGYFGYQLTPDGPRVYSLSENGVDDGGVHSPRWDDIPDPLTGSDDHVFFPPQL